MTVTAGDLLDWLLYRASATPDREALVADGRRWTFGELDRDASKVARQLGSIGIRPGDRVATLLRNGCGGAILPHATLRLGATVVPLNIRLTESEIAWQLRDSDARMIIVDEHTADLASRVCALVPQILVVGFDPRTSLIKIGHRAEFSPFTDGLRLSHDTAHVLAVIYTSGTTGKPKGAMLTVGNFWWSAVGSSMNIGARGDDRWLACLPLFHVGGLSIVFRAGIGGFAAIVHDGFDPDAVNRSIDEDRITIVSVVPTMLSRMLDARDDRAYPPWLRCVLLGGGPAPQSLLERCARLNVPVVQTYGLTETTSQIATLAPEDALPKLGSAGRAIYPNELRIVREDGTEADVAEPGEIRARGPVVMSGYAGQAAATAEVIVDGWLRTGDVGRIDNDKYLYVLDRRDDLIITGGENVYPAEVESVLLSSPDVAEAAVIGVPDSEWGQRVIAIVRLSDVASEPATSRVEAIERHCSASLARYKMPREFRIVTDPLPRTASGKVRRGALRDAHDSTH